MFQAWHVAAAPLTLGGSDASFVVALACGLTLLVAAIYVGWHLDPAYVFCAALVATLFSGQWQELHLPNALPPDRILLLSGIVMVLIRSPAVADRPGLRIRAVHLLLLIAGLCALASAAFAGTLTHSASLFRLTDRLGLVPFVMFAIAPLAFRTHAHRRALLATLVGIGAYLGLTAVLETTGPSALVLPHYINNPEAGLHFGRARGPFLEAQTMGLALFACGVAGCIGFYTWRTLEARLFSLAVTALCAAGVLFTLERATWLGAIGAAVVAMLAVRELRRYALPALTAGLILVIGLVAFVPGMSSKIHDRTDTTSAQRSTWDRKNLDAAAIRMTEAHPLFGVGWDRFVPDAGPYLRTSPDYPMSGGVDGHLQVVHNVFLSNAAELGLVGTFLWCIALVGALGSALLQRGDPDLRPWRIGLLANVVMWVVVSNLIPLSKPFPTLLLFTWAGLVYRPGFVRAPVPARRTLVGQSSVARPVIS